ncbi:transporter substrate-binding domain-containing protein [Pseudomonas sp. GD03944]|uniref:substrate-binding periplasmic protein n=1 Tax=Pseudomonas sp. GD03944 TaxID=2975409 RepID=UPI00244B0CAD|nr:transporter substrate-binding domain-containing protein [Pseudomonas sp. GD03944]MDH1265490.1 transporter substrate-binding domain-containing protein [Pseudomonas sp. GD03944]
MVVWWRVLLLALLVGNTAQAESAMPKEVRLASEVWADYTHADGSGLAWDLLREVFEPLDIKLEMQSVPYTRAIGLVQRGEADAWVGSYLNEIESGVRYPRWHYDADQISALGLLDKPTPRLDSLEDYRLVWVRGYAYQRYLPNLKRYQEVQRRSGILGMLNHDHADFYIDARTEVDDVLETAADPSRYRITDLTRLPLYLGFADTPRGQKLMELYDRRMDELVARGSLRPLFVQWQQPYPFD